MQKKSEKVTKKEKCSAIFKGRLRTLQSLETSVDFVDTIAAGGLSLISNYCQRYSSMSQVQRGVSIVSMRAINCCGVAKLPLKQTFTFISARPATAALSNAIRQQSQKHSELIFTPVVVFLDDSYTHCEFNNLFLIPGRQISTCVTHLGMCY